MTSHPHPPGRGALVVARVALAAIAVGIVLFLLAALAGILRLAPLSVWLGGCALAYILAILGIAAARAVR